MKSRHANGGFIQVNDHPGPGQYSTDKRTGHQGSKIGSGQRSGLNGGKDVTPGPGNYDLVS